MRKSQTRKINDVISESLREMKIDRKLKEVNLISQWEQLMGKTVAVRTNKIFIRSGVLYIHVTSSILKNELLMMRNQIKERLNESAGEILIESIVIK